MFQTENIHVDNLRAGIGLKELLFEILQNEDVNSLHWYIDNGLDINFRLDEGRTIAHYLKGTSVPFLEELVAVGLNIHAVDDKGYTALLLLAENELNIPVQFYLMSNGANPRNFNYRGKNCYSFVKTVSRNINEDFYLQFPYSKSDPTVNELLLKGELEMALQTVLFEINNVGGLERLLRKSNSSIYSNMFYYFQNALCANGKIEEANYLLKILNVSSFVRPFYLKKNYPTPVVSLLTKDYGTLFTYLEFLMESTSLSDIQKETAIIQSYLFSLIVGNEELIQEKKNMLHNLSSRKSAHLNSLKSILLAKTEYDILIGEKTLNNISLSAVPPEVSEMRFNEGLYYLAKGDLVTAEYRLRQSMNASYKMKYILKEFFSAKLLSDHIQSLIETK